VAFTHASWAADRVRSYERLEFLGDGVLGLAIAQHLFDRFPDRPEGDLARIRAHVVSRESCAEVAREMRLDRDLLAAARAAGAGYEAAPLPESDAVMAALVEAAIGAAFLERGFPPVAEAVVAAFAGRIEFALDEHVDYKTVLQEELARRGASVTYDVIETEGPPHQRRFTTSARVGEHELGRGSGPSKKASEQDAAREALAKLDRVD
jgi:ribonuclease III